LALGPRLRGDERIKLQPLHIGNQRALVGVRQAGAEQVAGGINRARRDVMPAMQDVRLKADGLTRFGPHELTGNENFN
jgi:hypothetical protein